MKPYRIASILILILIMGSLCLPGKPAQAQSSGPVEAGVFQALEAAPGTVIEAPVQIRNASQVYAIDIELQFDPAVLAAEDANPSSAGIQMGFGEFLDPGLALFNEVDLEKGIVRFAVSQINPSEPKSGDGVLFVIYFVGLKEGVSPLTVTNLQVASREGDEIASSGVDSTLTVSAGAPKSAATPIPVQDPGGMIQLPTPGPSSTPTLAPTAVPTAQPTLQAQPANPATASGQVDPAVETPADAVDKPFLVQNWWIILIVLLVAVIMGAFFLKNTSKFQKGKGVEK